MQEYLADLHIHSRFSRATSRKLDIPLLAAWGMLKGLAVLGTGDFTHPVWRAELQEHLRYDEASGLYALADPAAPAARLPELPVTGLPGRGSEGGPQGAALPRFMLQGEISSIYKRGGKVRKVHNLVFMPTLEAAEAFCLRLERLGNLHSDGRPILGLDSRDLLEMVLESHPLAFLVPAHIWTPWFSLFGSKSGFDRLEDCFDDLSGEIFAMETGLSSDPAMNRLWSALDGYRLISNSDAHSGENLGREANVFSGRIAYQGMLNALKRPAVAGETRFRGTLEFYPEEGKYHMDGHRNCKVVLTPRETRELGGRCPVCGGALTVGVLSRVTELADRDEPLYQPGDGALRENGFVSLVPLGEVLGEILGVGAKSRRVGDMYARALERFGPELTILRETPVDDLARFFPPLGEALRRMRAGEVRLQGGYDGEYGVVRMFTDAEQREIARGVAPSGRGRGGAARPGLLPGTPEQTAKARSGRKGKDPAAAKSGQADDADQNEDFAFSALDDPAAAGAPEAGGAIDGCLSDTGPNEGPDADEPGGARPRLRVKGVMPEEDDLMPDWPPEEGLETDSRESGGPMGGGLPDKGPDEGPAEGQNEGPDADEPGGARPRLRVKGVMPEEDDLMPDWPPQEEPGTDGPMHGQWDEPPADTDAQPEEHEQTDGAALAAAFNEAREFPPSAAGLCASFAPRSRETAPAATAASGPLGLNAEQERAVTAGPAPVLVLAGPGTGKTRTLIARILHLLDEGISSRRIVALTFTRRAATEMDARLAEALGKDAPLPRTDTLHALALELWHKTHADVPVLLSEESARRVFAEANPESPAAVLREAWGAVNLARERLEMPQPEFDDMARRYMAQKNAWNLADYTDLLEFWLEQTSSGLFRSPWGHVLVDEIQDLSPLQLTLIRSLLSSSGEGFFGIGDPDQSIYGFRGAHGDCLNFLRQAWPGLELVSLAVNYRSRPGILEAAHAVLGEAATSGGLRAARPQQARIHLFAAPTAEAEAAWIAERAGDLIGLGSHTLADAKNDELHALEADHSPGDIAVLVRTGALAAVYRKALARKGVPVSEPAADVFWADERVALILRSAGRMLGIAAPYDQGDQGEQQGENAAPLCPDKIFANGPLGVAAYLSAFPPFDELFWQSTAFRSLVKAYEANGGWAELITWTSLQNELELVRARGERVQVMSLHAAKGLEFRTVFLPALEDGLLPFAGPGLLTGKLPEKPQNPDHDENAEERRLFYVGLTRARDCLFLSHAGKRLLYGRELRLKPSRFLKNLPENLVSRSALVARAVRKEEHLTLL